MISRRALVAQAAAGGAGMVVGEAFPSTARSQEALLSAELRLEGASSTLSPMIFGQFIEFLGRGIEGGVYDPGSPLSDNEGIRLDVLEKVRGLNPPILRFPGGTYTKTYHWRDGVGPRRDRPVRPNLIWQGLVTNQFGTDEFIAYCRRIPSEPFITVNMGTGTAEEAADWVEYCNRPEGTSLATMRAKNGSPQPHSVKYWGLGNEEHAKEDAGGRLQDPEDYAREAWSYAKLMKLQDPSISLIAAGSDRGWNEVVLRSLQPVVDYISAHFYIGTRDGNPLTLIAGADDCETKIGELREQIARLAPTPVADYSQWYRFAPRSRPLMLALDEIGVWENPGPRSETLENVYNWAHALATATLYNIMIRNSDIVGMATWAQTVNILAPIMADGSGSIRQTIYYPMAMFRELAGDRTLKIDVTSPPINLPGAENSPCLDVSATERVSDGRVTLFVVNRHPAKSVGVQLPDALRARFRRMENHTLRASALTDSNSLALPSRDVFSLAQSTARSIPTAVTAPAMSISALVFLPG